MKIIAFVNSPEEFEEFLDELNDCEFDDDDFNEDEYEYDSEFDDDDCFYDEDGDDEAEFEYMAGMALKALNTECSDCMFEVIESVFDTAYEIGREEARLELLGFLEVTE